MPHVVKPPAAIAFQVRDPPTSRGFGTAGLGQVPVFEANPGRQAHEDAFGPPARLQAKQGSPVPDQVELHVAATAIQLELALALTVGRLATALDNGQVGIEVSVADGPLVGEALLEVAETFSPRVEDAGEGVVFADITGMARHYESRGSAPGTQDSGLKEDSALTWEKELATRAAHSGIGIRETLRPIIRPMPRTRSADETTSG